jgi:hypothetical protein
MASVEPPLANLQPRLGESRMKPAAMKKDRNRRDLLDDLYEERHFAIEHVVAIWLRNGHDDELEKALDVLTVAHTKATFEFASGSFSS